MVNYLFREETETAISVRTFITKKGLRIEINFYLPSRIFFSVNLFKILYKVIIQLTIFIIFKLVSFYMYLWNLNNFLRKKK